jgi:hypothetical protein
MGVDLGTLLIGKLELGLELALVMQRVDPMMGFDTDFDTAGSEAVKVVAAAVVAF